jgi:hypothetical protein
MDDCRYSSDHRSSNFHLLRFMAGRYEPHRILARGLGTSACPGSSVGLEQRTLNPYVVSSSLTRGT